MNQGAISLELKDIRGTKGQPLHPLSYPSLKEDSVDHGKYTRVVKALYDSREGAQPWGA